MNQDERSSQLSAMFDGELPSAECELLSRRLARDEQLRATWSRYSVIGAALRAEPLAPVRPDFARRVGAALAQQSASARRVRALRSAGLGTAVAAGVAGVAIALLRNGLPEQEQVLAAYTPVATRAVVPVASRTVADGGVSLRAVRFNAANPGNELFSYVVPPLSNNNSLAVPATLADYVVAHSEVSSSLARGSLLSALVSNELVQPAPTSVLTPPP